MNDDFNSPVLIAHLFDAVRIINSVNDRKSSLSPPDLELLKKTFNAFVRDVLGLKPEEKNDRANSVLDNVITVLLDMRAKAKADRNFKLSDEIRDKLVAAGVQVKDTKEGATWKV
jgi:cysteinyl-tRNA synthetase